MRTKTEYVFDFGGDSYRVTQVDADVWNVYDASGRLFAEFDAPPEDMNTEDKARTETMVSLTVQDKICCMCQRRVTAADDGLCTGCELDFDDDYDDRLPYGMEGFDA